MLIFCILVIYLILWASSVSILAFSRSPLSRPFLSNPVNEQGKKTVLLVVAHPDDESMFFSPTLLSLSLLDQYNVRVLCLSTGNANGLGSIRRAEMISACTSLKVPVGNVEIIDDPALQDGFHQHWSQEAIMQLLRKAVTVHKINSVISFDRYGISGHPNHCAVYNGVRNFLLHHVKDVQGKSEFTIEAWELISTNILRKYCGPVNYWCSIIERFFVSQTTTHYFYNQQLQISLMAMKQHASQWIWYRKLFIVFSHYTYVNALRRIIV
eukprot:c23557_g1_i2 orf=407-1210(+)